MSKTMYVKRSKRIKNTRLKNRLAAIALVLIGLLPVYLEQDATALVLFAFFAICLWFQSPDW